MTHMHEIEHAVAQHHTALDLAHFIGDAHELRDGMDLLAGGAR
jgi:hypothetical protein